MTAIDDLPRHYFGCILIDPPWKFKSYTAIRSQNPSSIRHVERHYETMTREAIEALPIKELAAPTGCHLFLWSTGPHLPQAIETITAWGFKYSGVAFTWIKLRKSFDFNNGHGDRFGIRDFHTGLGLTTRKNAEFCLLGRRGNAKRDSKRVRELIIAPRREHSRKPDETWDRIEVYCRGPYLELFARQPRDCWTSWGDEVGKFADA
jgi:N6-adenosine-specific RNA methylase IME4